MENIIQKVRKGAIALIRSDSQQADYEPGAGAGSTQRLQGYLVLPAELASAGSLDRLLSGADTTPVIVATRDRLEQLGVFSRPAGDPEEDESPVGDIPSQADAVAAERVSPADLERAAACLAGGSGPDHATSALAGIDLRCVDWAGVVNCPRPFEAAVDLCRLAGLAPAAILVRLPADRPDAGDGDLPEVSIAELVEYRKGRARRHLPRSGPRTRLPTRYGNFNLQAYEDPLTGQLHIALWMGQLQGPVLTRIHSECLTGDLFGSLRCDCGNQLALALSNIAENGEGILLYLRQEGRGIGLVNKLRSYVLQDQGFDTVEANRELGFGDDLRDYTAAGQMLKDLGVNSVRLLTNNPRKIRGLESCGIEVEARAPLVIEPCSDSKTYLEVKRIKLGHLLP